MCDHSIVDAARGARSLRIFPPKDASVGFVICPRTLRDFHGTFDEIRDWLHAWPSEEMVYTKQSNIFWVYSPDPGCEL